jgi:hypothetical protein
MDDPNALAFLKLPHALLTLLASRDLHDALQPVHHLVRLAHVMTAGAFFGAVGLLDLRLLRARATVPLWALARHIHPVLAWTFGIAMATGVVLFFADPIRVGSHAYFTPKLALMAFAFANAHRLHRAGLPAIAGDCIPPRVRLAGTLSLALWTGVMVCASLNKEAAPKVPLW